MTLRGLMDHRAVIASLTSQERGGLTAKSDTAGLRQLAFHWGAILALAWLIAVRVPVWPLLMIPQGILIVFLFASLHESVHRTAFRTGWLNGVAARASSFMIALPADWFRYFHFAHHRHTQDPENDPELASPKPETLRQYLLHVCGISIWWRHWKTLAVNAAGQCADDFVPANRKARVRAEARMMLVGYAAAIAGSLYLETALLLWVWVVPAVLGQPFLRLYLLAEHGRCPFVANMLENSRTTATTRLVRRLAWNMPYHAEHHIYPTVPFHRLPEFHALIERNLKQTETGYARFHAKYLGALR